MDTHAETISTLLSYSMTDFVVDAEEEGRIIGLIRTSPNLDQTLRDLDRNGWLAKLFARVDSGQNESVLVQSIGGRISPSGYSLVSSRIKEATSKSTMFERSYSLQQSLNKYGVSIVTPGSSPANLRAALMRLSSRGSGSDPFSGSGATGLDPKKQLVGAVDKLLLASGNKAAEQRYGNPIPGNLSTYLKSLSPDERKAQALVLLSRPIVSLYANSYYDTLPTRLRIIRAAANKYDLEPALLGAFILAEQRDQSQREDAKDYTAASSFMEGNTSIGLGQVVVSTARDHALFSDLLSGSTMSSLTHHEISQLLTSDEFNIFAVAKYIRIVADMVSKQRISALPSTRRAFPNIDLGKFLFHSSRWPDDNIRALASEYTSRPWDDRVSTGWGYFVYEAYNDMKASGGI